MTKKVFISLPMRGREINEIRKDMNDIFDLVKSGYAEFGEDAELIESGNAEHGEDVELIDTIWKDDPDPDVVDAYIFYLSRSIQALSKADFVVFHPGWRTARGCLIEHMICAMYNIPYFDISMDYGNLEDNEVKDYTHDWDLAGQINETLSEQFAKAEGLSEKDILDDEDVEDALGFEHDDVDDLVESDPDLNHYAQGNDVDFVVMDEFDGDGKPIDSDILEPGEYDADV